MFGQDLSKLTKKEIETGIANAIRLNEAAMEAFNTRLDDIERIHQKGPAIHADNLLIKKMVDFTMREMLRRKLVSMRDKKVWKNN